MIVLQPITTQQIVKAIPRSHNINSDLVVNGDFSQEGNELITNGDFATDSDWTKGTNCTIENGKAKYTNSPSGQGFTQSNFLTIGKNYKVTFTVSDFSLGSVKIRFPFNSTNTITSNGTYTEYGVATSDDFFFQNVGNTTLSIDNVSVKEVGQDWTTEGDVIIENGLATFSGTDELSRIIQQNVMTIGKQYQWTYEIKTKTSGGLRTSFFVNNDSNVDIPSELGFNTLQGVAFGTRISIKRHTDPTNISLTNISVREANTSDLISVILTEEGTQQTETLTNVPFLANLYYVHFYLTFSILKEDNFYTLEFVKDNETIHKAKAYCTQQDPKDFSINNSTYTSNTDDTQFVTL